jgi:proton-translocating NAD(P)+ transhydrogenase subunit alpha
MAFVEPTTATGIVAYLTIFVLAGFVGIEVISKVPSILHTPLMSGSNAIHGIVLVGALTIMGEAHGAAQLTLGFLAVFLATLNVVGGFVVTDRMLEMFKSKPGERARGQAAAAEDAGPTKPGAAEKGGGGGGGGGGGATGTGTGSAA